MNKLFKVITISVVLLFFSCEKQNDEESNVSVNDPCQYVTCFNGGECVDGDCWCLDGYSGPYCSEIVKPIKMRVSQVQLSSYDVVTSSGGAWDDSFLGGSSGPDIYIKLYKGSSLLFTSGNSYNSTGSTITYTNGLPIDIDYVESIHTLKFYDKDDIDDSDFLSDDDLMRSGTFTPWSGEVFPSIITYNFGDGKYQTKFFVEYFW